jgi:sensor domain CHASE-containing protein
MPTPSSNLKIGSDTLLYIGIALVVLLAAGIFAWKKIRNVRQQEALKDTLSLSFNKGESPLDVNV